MFWILSIAIIYFLCIIITIAYSPSSPGVRLACLAALSLIIDNTPRLAQTFPPSQVNISATYQTVLYMAIMLLVASDHVLIHKASNVYTKISQDRPFSQMSIFSRFIWSTDLILSQRGVNWSWQIPYLRRSPISIGPFLLKKSALLLFIVALSNALDLLIRDKPAFQGKVSMREGGFVKQAMSVGLFWWAIASSQLFNYTLSAILLVSLGIYEPYDWPSLYGSWSNTKSVRKFWGQTWHQLLRRPLQEHGKFVTEQILGLAPESKVTPYIQLYVAFFLSGLCHAVGDWAVTPSQLTNRTDTIVFFLLQAVIITLEDAVIVICHKLRLSSPPSVLCYLWVVAWMIWSSPIWMDGMLRSGVKFRYDDFLNAALQLGIWIGVLPTPGSVSLF